MKIYGIIGWKNSGKTSLMERLLACITAKGYTVSSVKHVHHDVDLDQPGKDTFRHRAAGATEVVLASANRFALMREHRGSEPALTEILARLSPVDLVLVEGYKRDAHPKIEVFRAEAGHSLIQPTDPTTRAVATDTTLPALTVPVLDLNDTEAVARFILQETGLARTPPFDTVTIVDWSAASSPSPKLPSKDAIWIGVARTDGVTTTYHRTRQAAETYLTGFLDAEAAAGRRVLVGFDFPMGYPQGFAFRLTGKPDPRAIWEFLEKNIQDRPDNRNNRLDVADLINRTVGRQGPFWVTVKGLSRQNLPFGKVGKVDFASLRLSEFRHIELSGTAGSPKSVWQLFGNGSVGSQSLMGLPLIHRLSQRPGASVWPFDAPNTPFVMAEVYPSLLSAAVKSDPAPIKDEAQVRLLARALFNLSKTHALAPLFATPPQAKEEGWILGMGHHAALLGALS